MDGHAARHRRAARDRMVDAADLLGRAGDELHAAEIDLAAGQDVRSADDVRTLRRAVKPETLAVHRALRQARQRLTHDD